jgi:hypothetical protein
MVLEKKRKTHSVKIVPLTPSPHTGKKKEKHTHTQKACLEKVPLTPSPLRKKEKHTHCKKRVYHVISIHRKEKKKKTCL